MHKIFQILMIFYTVCFFLLCVYFVQNDVTNGEPIGYVFFSACTYAVATTGNLIWVFNRYGKKIMNCWKVISFIILGNFLLTGFQGNYNHSIDFITDVLIWMMGIIFFLPAFFANFSIGYRVRSTPRLKNAGDISSRALE